ncbi:MAG: hypothetical protein NTU53_13330 [Planctomycetota bacterium]|nr:hypothetical protein [Planctomycetota bacterium]
MSCIRHALRLYILISALLAAMASPLSSPSTTSDNSLAAFPEVRLRKLHLVRPDLILYPFAYEVLC